MLVEHLDQHRFTRQHFDPEPQFGGTYRGFDMNNFGSIDSSSSYAALPYSIFDTPGLFVEAPLDDVKYDLKRSTSSVGSLNPASHHSSEVPYSLVSSASVPSVPSATSSTVGSPYSGHSHTVSHDSWTTNPGFGLQPVIANHEGYTHEYMGNDFDPELFASQSKLSGSFVGECADLSSFPKRSSRFAINDIPKSLSVSQPIPFSASPEILNCETFHNRYAIASADGQEIKPVSLPPTPSALIKQQSSGPQKADKVFKSPTTPASARSRTPSTLSPVAARVARCVPSPSLSASLPLPGHSAASALHQPTNHFQAHFFAQSSGSFMPPLELSYPSLIQGPRASYPEAPQAFAEQSVWSQQPQPYQTGMSPAHSPTPSPQTFNPYTIQHYSTQPNYANPQYPYPMVRQPSVSSFHSGQSHQSPMSSDFDDETREKGRCPHPDCGRVFKDLKAHMLTHQSERPEKCPILHCEYNQKGFARKYDKNRHTLTHYKGTMVCGFCPGSGSAAEKSFNRADVFKRHLTSVHGVEQTPPNSRKRSPTNSSKKLSSYCQDATGKCSTCSATFSNAQDFYEHLDDCVLRVVQQEEDSEAINAVLLGKMAEDDEVKQTLERHLLNPNPETTVATNESNLDEDDDDEEEDEEDGDSSFNERFGKGGVRSTKASSSSQSVLGGAIRKAGRPPKKGLTRSSGGVALVGKGRKKRKHYPPSWGMAADKMQMKKRVLCVYDGERRLWKDDLMMHNEFEVRMKLPDSKSYVTDLDVETLKRAEAFHNATQEEKGPWNPHTDGMGTPFDLEALMS